MTAALVAGLLAGYGVALPMGAVGTYLVLLSARTSMRIGAAVTALNPTTIVYFTALVLGNGAIAASPAQGAAFVVATAAASASWQLILAGSGALLGRALTSRRTRVITALGSSALIAFLAARLLI